MPESCRSRVWALALAVSLAVWMLPTTAAGDEIDACLSSHEKAQSDTRDAKYASARQELKACTRAVCPAPIQEDCKTWLYELDQAQPTVVIVATDGADNTISDVRVTVDGKVVAQQLDGRALGIDPGDRRIRVALADGRSQEARLLIVDGQKRRLVRVRFADQPAEVPTDPDDVSNERSYVAEFILVGFAGVAITAFAVLAGVGFAREQELEDTCQPNCPSDDVDEVRRIYNAADVMGVVGIASGIAALVVFLAWDGGEDEGSTRSFIPTPNGLQVRF